jgi:hypothetical protein
MDFHLLIFCTILSSVSGVQRMEENRIPKRVLSMKLEATRPRGRPRNRWQDEVRENGSIIDGEEWQRNVYDGEEWKKLLRAARNHRILHMPMELMNECQWCAQEFFQWGVLQIQLRTEGR